jgi:DNA polymerase-3 subunit alpha
MTKDSLSASDFIHLHLHSSYSLLEGAITTKKLQELCLDHSMPAVAITDTGNMFAALEVSELLSNSGIQPIIGCQINLMYNSQNDNLLPAPIVLLAKDQLGYQNLMKLSTISYLEHDQEDPFINLTDLESYNEGLIFLSGGVNGPLGQLILRSSSVSIEALTNKLCNIFGDRFYLEIQRHPTQIDCKTVDEGRTESTFLALALKKNIPIVATNDVFFPKADMYEAHDALLCISSGSYIDQKAPRKRVTSEHYFKSADEMKRLFFRFTRGNRKYC